jgi:hypothetical protein
LLFIAVVILCVVIAAMMRADAFHEPAGRAFLDTETCGRFSALRVGESSGFPGAASLSFAWDLGRASVTPDVASRCGYRPPLPKRMS